MINSTIVILVLLIAITNYYFTRWFIRYAKVRRITDIPTERSSHSTPTPRGGGVGFVVLFILALVVHTFIHHTIVSTGLIFLIIAVTIVSFLGWFDDKYDLSKEVRFLVQSAAAMLVILFISNFDQFYLPYVGGFHVGIAGAFLGLFWITAATNIYNFMDGVDGIASVQALSAAAGWALFAYLWNEPVLFAINFYIIAGISAFLMYNWAPAKLFMGDVGSVFLGFLFAVMPFMAAYLSDTLHIGNTIWIAGILLWPFLFDGTFTILRRLYEGENVFEAHRTHLYQKLNIAGWEHSSISRLYLYISIVCIGLAITFSISGSFVQVIIVVSLLCASFIFAKFVYASADSIRIKKNNLTDYKHFQKP